MWRLVFSDGNLDYNTVFHQMTPQEIEEANIALNIYSKKLKEQSKSK